MLSYGYSQLKSESDAGKTSYCALLENTVSLNTISARMLNKYGERTQLCQTLFLTQK